MKRVLSLASILIVVMTAALLIVRHQTLGGVWPFPLNTLNQTASCQLPCWHGITPGQTSRAKAVALMDADPLFSRVVYPDSGANMITWRFTARPEEDYSVILSLGDGITGIFLAGRASPAQVVAALGPPTQFIPDFCDRQLAFIIPGATLFLDQELGVSIRDNSVIPGWNMEGRLFIPLRPQDSTSMAYPDAEWQGLRSNYARFQGDMACD